MVLLQVKSTIPSPYEVLFSVELPSAFLEESTPPPASKKTRTTCVDSGRVDSARIENAFQTVLANSPLIPHLFPNLPNIATSSLSAALALALENIDHRLPSTPPLSSLLPPQSLLPADSSLITILPAAAIPYLHYLLPRGPFLTPSDSTHQQTTTTLTWYTAPLISPDLHACIPSAALTHTRLTIRSLTPATIPATSLTMDLSLHLPPGNHLLFDPTQPAHTPIPSCPCPTCILKSLLPPCSHSTCSATTVLPAAPHHALLAIINDIMTLRPKDGTLLYALLEHKIYTQLSLAPAAERHDSLRVALTCAWNYPNSFHAVKNYCNTYLEELLGRAKERWERVPGVAECPEWEDLCARYDRAAYYKLPYSGISSSTLPLLPVISDCVHEFAAPILTPSQCAQVIAASESYAAVHGWSTARHYSVPTTDLDVSKVAAFRWLVEECVVGKILPAIEEVYGGVQAVNDVFVVKYDARDGKKGQVSLPAHCDQSNYSFTLALNHGFSGGGTRFVGQDITVRPAVGGCCVFKGGTVEHEGREITEGVRYVVVGFVWKGGEWGERERREGRKIWKQEGGEDEERGLGFSFGFGR